jgi:predicted phage terminase large subunit-like protein
VVEQKRRTRLVYAGQYQQRPAPLEGNLIKRSEVKYHSGIDPITHIPDEQLPELRKFLRIFISVDASFKEMSKNAKSKDDPGNTTDYCAVGVIGVLGRKRMVLDVVNEHLDVNGLEMVIKQKRAQWNATAVIVEDKANGPAVVQRLSNTIPGVIEVTPEGGKIARMFAAAPEWQAGDWYVNRNAAWAAPFIDQITMFPMSKHDDMVDCMTQAAIWLQQNKGVEVWAQLG